MYANRNAEGVNHWVSELTPVLEKQNVGPVRALYFRLLLLVLLDTRVSLQNPPMPCVKLVL